MNEAETRYELIDPVLRGKDIGLRISDWRRQHRLNQLAPRGDAGPGLVRQIIYCALTLRMDRSRCRSQSSKPRKRTKTHLKECSRQKVIRTVSASMRSTSFPRTDICTQNSTSSQASKPVPSHLPTSRITNG